MGGSTRTIAKNTLYNAIGGVTVQLLTIVTGIFVARHFGAESFGQLTYVATLVGYFALITEFGLSTIAIRIVAGSDEPQRYVFSYLLLRLALSILAVAVLGLLMWWMELSNTTFWLLVAYGMTIPSQVIKMNWVFYAQQKMWVDNLLQVSEKIFYIVGLFALVFAFSNIIVVPVAMVASTFLSAVLGWFIFIKTNQKAIDWRFDPVFIRKLVTQGWPIGVAGAALRSNTNADTLFVNAYHGDAATGFYGAAYRLINAMITAGTFFTNAIFPISCRRYTESRESLSGFIGYSGKLLTMLTVPAVVLFSVHADWIIHLIFGDDYAGAVTPFRMLVWAAGLAIVSRLLHNTLVACERQHGYMKIILASTVFNLVCNFVLIPPYGLMGAASATIITELLLLVLTYIALYRALKMEGLWDVALVAVCALIAATVFLLPVNSVSLSTLYLAIYTLLLLGLRLLGRREWQLLRAIVARN